MGFLLVGICHVEPSEEASNQASNYFTYQWTGPVLSPGAYILSLTPPSLLKFIHLLHLNQASIKDFICDLTYSNHMDVNGKELLLLQLKPL